jgi:hypothetical protein
MKKAGMTGILSSGEAIVVFMFELILVSGAIWVRGGGEEILPHICDDTKCRSINAIFCAYAFNSFNYFVQLHRRNESFGTDNILIIERKMQKFCPPNAPPTFAQI